MKRFHVLLQEVFYRGARRAVNATDQGMGDVLLGRKQGGDGDGRSDFHTRVQVTA